MSKFEKIDFIIKTMATAGAVVLANSELAITRIGQFLGRSISQMPIPAAYAPFASAAAITVISDAIEYFVVDKFFQHTEATDENPIVTYNRPIVKALSEIVIRVLVGAGLFAAGVAVTGGTILPALATGAAVGSLVYVANKVIDIFKCIVLAVSYLTYFFCLGFNPKESDVKPVDGFKGNLMKSISPSTFTLVNCFLPNKNESKDNILIETN